MSLKERVSERVKSLGRLGKFLSSYLPSEIRDSFLLIGLENQLSTILTMFSRGNRRAAVAVMALCCDVMIQLPVGDVETTWLVGGAFEKLDPHGRKPIDLAGREKKNLFR